ncbi:ABC transporter permease [Enterococcus sp. DIV1420a]|uniref:ABC transporter permease n=1 Tax=Enterococcus sp. DIV1420a TaxID=2774672 RepID=UPI0036D62AAE
MYKLSYLSVKYVIIRNYMSFKKLFKISIFPNLVDPILYLIGLGFGLSKFVGEINGMTYFTFVSSGLIAATAMSASTAEATTNAFIQMRIEKTYYAIAMTPVNLQDIVIGQAIWAGVRSVIFGTMFLILVSFFGVVHSWTVILIPIVLFVTGIIFGLLGLTFTALAPSRDYVNYYNVLIIQPLYMFSDTFFPLSSMSSNIKFLGNFSPLYHAANLCRGLLVGNMNNFLFHMLSLILFVIVLFYLPMIAVNKKLIY